MSLQPRATRGGSLAAAHEDGAADIGRRRFARFANQLTFKLPGKKELAVAFAAVERRPDGAFGTATWVEICGPASQGLLTGNSILKNNLIGIYQPASGQIQSYLAVVEDVKTLRRAIGG